MPPVDNPEAYAIMAQAVNPYGDGWAADGIVRALLGEAGPSLPTMTRD